MYKATASSNGLAQGGHRGLARVTALPGSAQLPTPPQYASNSPRSESDDSASVQSDATSSNGQSSSPAKEGKTNRSGVVAAVLLAFCVGAIAGAFAYRGHERHATLDTYSSELVEQNRLLHNQSSVSQSPHAEDALRI